MAIVHGNRKWVLRSESIVDIERHSAMHFAKLSTQQFFVLQSSETEASAVEPNQCWAIFALWALIDSDDDFGAVSRGYFVIYFFDGLGSFVLRCCCH